MSRPKGRPKNPHGEGTQVRIDADLVSMARYITSRSEQTLTEYLSGLLRPLIARDFREAGERLASELKRPKGGGS